MVMLSIGYYAAEFIRAAPLCGISAINLGFAPHVIGTHVRLRARLTRGVMFVLTSRRCFVQSFWMILSLLSRCKSVYSSAANGTVVLRIALSGLTLYVLFCPSPPIARVVR